MDNVLSLTKNSDNDPDSNTFLTKLEQPEEDKTLKNQFETLNS